MELIGGAYAARSVIGNAQKCINLLPERNRKDGPQTMTHYQRPGYRGLSAPPKAGVGRGIFRTFSGQAYCVVGQNVFSIGPNFAFTQIGQLLTNRTNLCSLSDNGVTAVLGDGSQFGYQIALGNNAFTQIADPTGTFLGTIKWDYLDGFLLWVLPQSNFFGSTNDDSVTFNPTYIAAKTGAPDYLQTLYVNRHQILLLGQIKSEIWYDAGNPLFPFAILPGAYIEQGILAPYSVASQDVDVYWLGQNLQGIGLVIHQRGYETKVISNYAISNAIEQMAAAGADLTDATGYTYSKGGHIFYVLTFVSGDQTWVYDASIADPELAWHQRGWTSPDGVLHRERACSHAFINNTNVVQDWQNGSLYALDDNYYFDYVGGIAGPINYTRTFPQLYIAKNPQGMPMMADGLGIKLNRFTADLECGNGPIGADGTPPNIGLRVSFDKGKSFGNFVLQSTGMLGEYATEPKWAPLGIGRFPVLELNYSFAAPAALNGGWIDAMLLNQ